MSSLVIRSLLLGRNDRRIVDRTRTSRRFRFGHEWLEDRITPVIPTVTGLSQTFGPALGTTPVTITGTGFTGATAVDFGTVSAGFTFVNATTITTVSPPGTGVVDVTVTASGGTSPLNPPNDQFTYGPTVTGLSPTSGPATGNTTVTIIGTGFISGSTTVFFGTAQATNVTFISTSSVTAVSPPGSGTVDVTVTTFAGTSPISPADQFTYPSVPTVQSITPTSGTAAGGTTVTIIGTNFSGSTPAVDFGTNPATGVQVLDPTEITAVSPAGTGIVDVTVTAAGGTSPLNPPNDQFTYGPTVMSVSPTSGVQTGGTAVTIAGTNLANVTSVEFGPTAATSFTIVSNSQISAVSPAAVSPGVVNVTVTAAGLTSPMSSADQFTYTEPAAPPPTVSSISPTAGPPSGGTSVTIIGTEFINVTGVKFGTTPALSFTSPTSATTMTAVSPPGTGTVDVTVITTGGTSAMSAADQFSYGPTITSLSPRSGPQAGGTEVTITGVNLANATAVNFGTVGVDSFISDTATQIVLLSPAGASPGAVNLTVTTAGGTSAPDLFFYSAIGAVAPRVNSISPAFGSPDGGTAVTITGAGFDQTNPALVYFGTVAATSETVTSTTTITAVSPAGTGTVDVTVTTFGGTSPTTPADLFTYTVDGPQVTNVQRFGFHAQPTFLVITFTSTLDPVPATKVSNYVITGPKGRRIRVSSASYNATTHTVTLRPAQMLNLRTTYILTINGTAPSGLTDIDGLLLDGARTGRPGSNFVTSITSSNLAGSASERPVAAVVKARARSFVVRAKLFNFKHER